MLQRQDFHPGPAAQCVLQLLPFNVSIHSRNKIFVTKPDLFITANELWTPARSSVSEPCGLFLTLDFNSMWLFLAPCLQALFG